MVFVGFFGGEEGDKFGAPATPGVYCGYTSVDPAFSNDRRWCLQRLR